MKKSIKQSEEKGDDNMAYKYRYTGGVGGVMSFVIDEVAYTIGNHDNHPKEITLNRKLTDEELNAYIGLALIEEETEIKKPKRVR